MNNNPKNNRRTFLKDSAKLGAMLAIAPQFLTAGTSSERQVSKKDTDFAILFQGDSITDGNRKRNNDWNHVMGHGYQYIIASKLWYEFPGKGLKFFNRGVSGNKVRDLAGRWEKDTINLEPDLLSILVGVNDTSGFITGNKELTAALFEQEYRELLDRTKKQLPNIQLVLGEPFLLPVGYVKEKWKEYSAEIKKRQEIVKELAMEFNAVHVEFQKAFDKALNIAPPDYWIWDGVHPMPAGHELMAREWIEKVGQELKFPFSLDKI